MFAVTSKSDPNRDPLAPESSRRRDPEARAPTSLLLWHPFPPRRPDRGGRRYLIKQRERAACPQLRCVPPDLRGDGARHASRESLPPSKPYRPHAEELAGGALARTNPSIVRSVAHSGQLVLSAGVAGLQALDFAPIRPA